MGIIVALLVAHGTFTQDTQLSLTDYSTAWIILSCHLAMAVGTMLGGWRIVKTMGSRSPSFSPWAGSALRRPVRPRCSWRPSWAYRCPPPTPSPGHHRRRRHPQADRHQVDIAFRIIMAWIVTIPCSAVISALTFFAIALMR